MVHIILLILKIIGIAIAVILGLLLLCVCAVLFVPVRYRGNVKYYGQLEGEGGIFWLLHLVSIRAVYNSQTPDGPRIVVKILGRRIFDSGKNEKNSSDNTKNRKLKEIPKEKPKQQESGARFKEDAREKPQAESGSGTPRPRKEKPPVQERAALPPVPKENTLLPPVPEENTLSPVPKRNTLPPPKESSRGSFLSRLYEKLRRSIAGLVTKVRAFAKGLSQKLKGLLEKLRFVRDKKDAILAILFDEKNRPAFLKIKYVVFRVLRHLKPTHLAGKAYFGFDDPASTGYVLGLLSLLYPVCEDHLMLYPNFEKKIFEGEASFAGRLRASVFLFAACQLIFDKEIRRLIRSFKIGFRT